MVKQSQETRGELGRRESPPKGTLSSWYSLWAMSEELCVKDLGAVHLGMGRGAALHRPLLVKGVLWGMNSPDLQVCRAQTWSHISPGQKVREMRYSGAGCGQVTPA